MLARHIPRSSLHSVAIQIDGNPATLVDLSVAGAAVLSATILRPRQRVRLLLPSASPPLRAAATVAWATLEVPRGRALYRAGLTFVDADPAAIERFIAAHTHEDAPA